MRCKRRWRLAALSSPRRLNWAAALLEGGVAPAGSPAAAGELRCCCVATFASCALAAEKQSPALPAVTAHAAPRPFLAHRSGERGLEHGRPSPA